jgi:hypothetical protein
MSNVTKLTPPQAVPHYKRLDDGKSRGDYAWSLPIEKNGEWQPGEWQEVEGDLEQCANGLHLTIDPFAWFGHHAHPEFYHVEIDGLVLDCGNEVVARRVRLTRPLTHAELVALNLVACEVPAPTEPIYAVLHDGECLITRVAWPLPSRAEPGEWRVVDSDLTQQNGIWLTMDPKEGYRVGHEVYRAEVEGNVLQTDRRSGGKPLIARKARLVSRLTSAEMDALGIGVEKKWKSSRYGYRSPGTIRKRIPTGTSPAMKLITVVHDHALTNCKRKGDNLFNTVMGKAFALAIESGMAFALSDFADFTKMRSGGWLDNEWSYGTCVESGNVSACKSWESWKKREPWMWQGSRLYVRAKVFWAGRDCRVTSIDDKAGTINLCSYKPQPRDKRGHTRDVEKIDRRFVVKRETFALAEKQKRRGDKLQEEIVEIQKTMEAVDAKVDRYLIALWSEAQIAEVMEWARQTKIDRGKRRVAAPTKPAFLVEAVAATLLHGAEHDAAMKAWEKADYKGRPREIKGTVVAEAEKACLDWAEALFDGRPADYLPKPKAKRAA